VYSSIDMSLARVDTHLVVALHALLTERSVSAAARRVGVTQPTMSHALARLRAHFGDPLLLLRGRTMTVTETARLLVEPVTASIKALERVFDLQDSFDPSRDERSYRLASTDNLELVVLPALIRLLGQEAPKVTLRCNPLPSTWVEELLRGELHVKLGRDSVRSHGLRSEVLMRETLICAVRRGHPATRGAFTLKRYASYEHLLVAPRGGESSLVDQRLAAHGLTRHVRATVPHFLVAPHIVASTDLVLTAPSRVLDALAPSLDLVMLPCPLALQGYDLTMTWAHRNDGDPGVSWLLEAIRKAVRAPAGLRSKGARRAARAP
jgi:DNA-binding transcriptional LysR family regulator